MKWPHPFGEPVGGVKLHPQLVGVVHGDSERVDPFLDVLGPVFYEAPILEERVVVDLQVAGGAHAADLGEIRAQVSGAGFPVDASEVGVPVALQQIPDRAGLAVGHDPRPHVLGGHEALSVRPPPVGLQGLDLLRLQGHQLDVADPNVFAGAAPRLSRRDQLAA